MKTGDIGKLFGFSASPADAFVKELKRNFNALKAQGHSHMVIILYPDEKGPVHYGPFSCGIGMIGTKENLSKVIDEYNKQDMPAIWTFNLHKIRPFEDQLRDSQMMDHFPDMTEPVRRSLYGLGHSIPEMPPVPVTGRHSVKTPSLLQRAFRKPNTSDTVQTPRITAFEYRIAQEYDRAHRMGQHALLLLAPHDRTAQDNWYTSEFLIIPAHKNPHTIIRNYEWSDIPVILALDTTTNDPWYKKLGPAWRPGDLTSAADLYKNPRKNLLGEEHYPTKNMPEDIVPEGKHTKFRVITNEADPQGPRQTNGRTDHLRVAYDSNDAPKPKP